MNSMTGFGRSEIRRRDYKLRVELASVNSRFLECVFRMPRLLAGAEGQLKEMVNQKISRGKITITVNLEESPEAAAKALIDQRTATAFYDHLVGLKKRLKLAGDITLSHVLAFPQLLAETAEAMDEARLMPDLMKAMTGAVAELRRMRAVEGNHLKRDMLKRLRRLTRLVAAVEKQSPENIAAYRQRLEKRIYELGNGIALDPQRLAEELTLYADRCDVTEECIRLGSHVKMFAETLEADAEAGKRLNFILQEMGREANTIGSKSLSGTTSAHAITLKEEIEKLREQAQNIE